MAEERSLVGDSLLVKKEVSAAIDSIGNNGFLQKQLLILGPCLAADAIEVTAFGYILNVIEIDGVLLASDSFYGGLVSSIVFVGMFIGGILCGFISDKFGRKQILLLCMGINVFATLQGAVTLLLPVQHQMLWLVISRFLAGFGASGTIPAAFTLAVEFAPSNRRFQAINFLDLFWSLGVVYVSLVALLILSSDAQELEASGTIEYHHWPIFTLIAGLPAAITLVLTVLYLEESPVYIEKYEADKSQIPLLLEKMSRTKLAQGEKNLLSCFPVDRERIKSNDVNNHDYFQNKESSPVTFSLTDSLMKTLLLRMIISYFCISFAVYGLSSWITIVFDSLGFTSNPYLPSLGFAFVVVPAAFASIYSVAHHEIRKAIILSLLTSCVCVLFTLKQDSVPFILFGTLGFQFFSNVAFTLIDILSINIFPTSTKGTAFGLITGSGRIAGMTAGFVNGLLLNSGSHGGLQVLMLNGVVVFICALSLIGVRDPKYNPIDE